MTKIEYRVRPVTRYIVTRYEGDEEVKGSGGVNQCGEYNNPDVAFEVAYALCRAEHEQKGWPPGDTRIIYPERIEKEKSEVGQLSVSLTADTEQLEASLDRVGMKLAGIAATAERTANALHAGFQNRL